MGISFLGTLSNLGLAMSAHTSAIIPAVRERTKTTISGLMPDSIMTLVVEAFTPNKSAAAKAYKTPSVGCFWLNSALSGWHLSGIKPPANVV